MMTSTAVFGHSSHQDDFELLFDNVLYVSTQDVTKFNDHQEVVEAILTSTKKRSRLSRKGNKKSPVMKNKHINISVTVDSVAFTDTSTQDVVFEAGVRDISYCCRGPDSTAFETHFAIVCVNRIGPMIVGFACHVIKADSRMTAEAIVSSFGQLFKYMVDSYSMHSNGDGSHLSSQSPSADGASHDSGVLHEPELTVSSPDTIKRDTNVRTFSPKSSPLTSRNRGHRRILSDGAVDVSKLQLFSQTKKSNVNTDYLLRQTGQNLYRRLHGSRDALIRPHKDSRGIVHAMCFSSSSVISWMIKEGDCESRSEGVSILQALSDASIIEPLSGGDSVGSRILDAEAALYRFAQDKRRRTISNNADSPIASLPQSPKTSRTNLLDLIQPSLPGLPDQIGLCLQDDNASMLRNLIEDLTSEDLTNLVCHTAIHGAVNCLQALIDVKCNVNAQTRSGNTALHCAALYGHLKLARILVNSGSEVNAKNSRGETPLMLAAEKAENLEFAMMLLENGAEIYVADKKGARPVDKLDDLAEAQRLMCSSVIKRLSKHPSLDDIISLQKVSRNREVHGLLFEQFTPQIVNSLKELCSELTMASEILMNVISKVFDIKDENDDDDDAPSDSRRPTITSRKSINNLIEEEALVGLLNLLDIDGAVRNHCVTLLRQLIQFTGQRTGHDQLPHLATLNLEPLLTAVLDRDEAPETILKCGDLFALIMRHTKARQWFAQKHDAVELLSHTETLVKLSADNTPEESKSEIATKGKIMTLSKTTRSSPFFLYAQAAATLLETLGTIMADYGRGEPTSPVESKEDSTSSTSSALTLSSESMQAIVARVAPLLKNDLFPIKFQATRCMVMCGKYDLPISLSLFRQTSIFTSVRDTIKINKRSESTPSSQPVSDLRTSTNGNEAEPPGKQSRRRSLSMMLKKSSKSLSDKPVSSLMDASSPVMTRRENPFGCDRNVWKNIKGASMERAVELMTDVSDVSIEPCQLTFLAYRAYFQPFGLLRLLLHRFCCVKVPEKAEDLHPVHERVFKLFHLWIETALCDFLEHDMLLHELQEFLLRFTEHSSAIYQSSSESLLNKVINNSFDDNLGYHDYKQAIHNRLYRRARKAVLSGDIPISKTMAIFLAALQVHIADLTQQGATLFSETIRDEMPRAKVSSILPRTFTKGKESKSLLNAVQKEYPKIRHLSPRDAKHLYLQIFQLTSSHDCEYFPVKQVLEKKKVSRVLGLSPTRVLLLDDKTKQLSASYSRQNLERVEWRHKDKGSFLGKGKGTLLAFVLHGKGGVEELLLSGGDDQVLKNIVEFLKQLPTTLPESQADSGDEQEEETVSDDGLLDVGNDEDEDDEPSSGGLSHQELDYRLFRPSSNTTIGTISEHRSLFGSLPRRKGSEASPSATMHRHDSSSQQPTLDHSRDPAIELAAQIAESHGKVLQLSESFCDCPPPPAIDSNFTTHHITVTHLLRYPIELARQLTIIDQSLFRNVLPQECLQRVWLKKLHLSHERPNAVEKIIDRFNQVSQWVATVILGTSDTETRCWVMESFIDVATELHKLRNFQGVMAVTSALAMTPIRRLTDTWALMHEAHTNKYLKLEKLMHAEDNFKNYRAALNQCQPPSIPYFGILLRDLTFSHEGNPDYVRGGLINIYKIRQMLALIGQMKRLQSKEHNLYNIPEVTSFLSKVRGDDEDHLFKKSKMIQPPQIRRMSSFTKFWGSDRKKLSRKTSSHNLGFRRPPSIHDNEET